jgi:hypothetical protein
MEMILPQGWSAADATGAAGIEADLRSEMHSSHQLCGRELRALAYRKDRDDVLFGPRRSAARCTWFTRRTMWRPPLHTRGRLSSRISTIFSERKPMHLATRPANMPLKLSVGRKRPPAA